MMEMTTRYFTFGHGQAYANHHVKVVSCNNNHRELMRRVHGSHWSFEYSEEEFLPTATRFNSIQLLEIRDGELSSPDYKVCLSNKLTPRQVLRHPEFLRWIAEWEMTIESDDMYSATLKHFCEAVRGDLNNIDAAFKSFPDKRCLLLLIDMFEDVLKDEFTDITVHADKLDEPIDAFSIVELGLMICITLIQEAQ